MPKDEEVWQSVPKAEKVCESEQKYAKLRKIMQKYVQEHKSTGGPRYLRTQYSRFRLFAIGYLLQNLSIREFFKTYFAYLRFFL